MPEELDTPPFILGFDPDVVIDLREDGPARFIVDAVYDMNPPEDIDWVAEMYLTPDATRPFPVAADSLRIREVQSFDGATEYEGFEIQLDRCPMMASARGDSSFVTLDLQITDPLPSTQQQEGFEAFTARYTWRVRVVGECEQ